MLAEERCFEENVEGERLLHVAVSLEFDLVGVANGERNAWLCA